MIIKYFVLTFLILCTASVASAQAIDYTGIWNGKFYDNSSFGSADDTYRFEVQIAQTNKALQGVTYSYQSTRFYGKASQNGYIKTDGKKIVIQETKMIELKMDIGVACLMTCTMKYSKIGNDEYLEGSYTAAEQFKGTACQGGYVKLKKVKKSIFGTTPIVQKKLNEIAKKQNALKPKAPVAKLPTAIPKPKPTVVAPKPKPTVVIPKPTAKPTVVKPTPKPIVIKVDTTKPVVIPPIITPPIAIKPIPPQPTILQQRKTEIVQSIEVNDSMELVIDFYDYGEVDGDVVTIYVNNVAIVSQKPLGTNPIQVPIKLSAANPVVEVVMYADNLGTIPPNTAYMVVRVNGKKYDATIESTEQKNASVKFVYKPIVK